MKENGDYKDMSIARGMRGVGVREVLSRLQLVIRRRHLLRSESLLSLTNKRCRLSVEALTPRARRQEAKRDGHLLLSVSATSYTTQRVHAALQTTVHIAPHINP